MVTADFKLEFSGLLPVVDKHWARVTTSYDATKKYAFKFVGDKWIQKWTLYNLPLGTTILAYEHCFDTKQIIVRVLAVDPATVAGKQLAMASTYKTPRHWIDDKYPSGESFESRMLSSLRTHWGKEEYDYNFFVNKEQREEENRHKRSALQDYNEASVVAARLFHFAQTAPLEEAKKVKSYLALTIRSIDNRINTQA